MSKAPQTQTPRHERRRQLRGGGVRLSPRQWLGLEYPSDDPAPPVPARFVWKLLFFALPIVYFFAYGRYGLAQRDDGFVLALAWRVINGEWPHRDFIYVRPAIPCYVHALPLLLLPESLQMISDRFLFYVMAAASNYWFASAIDRWLPLRRIGLEKFLLASVSFIFSVHNFPPMAWTTTDGIFFICLGFYLLTRGPHPGWIAGGMAGVILGLLCKQSFFAMPVIAIAVAGALYGWRAAVTAVASSAVLGALVAGAAVMMGVYGPFMAQTTNTTARGGIFIYNGFIVYLLEWKLYLAPAAVLIVLRVAASWRKLPEALTRHLYGAAGSLLCAAVMGESLYYALKTQSFHIPIPMARSLLFLGVISFMLLWRPLRDKATILPGAFIVLSWSVSATNGYITPALCSGPLVYSIFYASVNMFSPGWSRFAVQFLLWGGLITFAVANQFPYQCAPSWKCVYDMGKLFRKASFIRTDEANYERYKELKELAAKYGGNFKTLPCVPLANYLTSTRSPIQLDWAEDFELPGKWTPVAQKLDRSGAAVFLFKDLMDTELLPQYSFGGINSTITFYVKETWKRVEAGKHYDVYKREDGSTSSPK
ncbi:MAG: hypothetical protein WCK47_01585 [bacterium]|nr:hypothetical protein [Candidatus Sumerlaeota bacterium]